MSGPTVDSMSSAIWSAWTSSGKPDMKIRLPLGLNLKFEGGRGGWDPLQAGGTTRAGFPMTAVRAPLAVGRLRLKFPFGFGPFMVERVSST